MVTGLKTVHNKHFWSMYRILGKGIPLNVGKYKFCSCGPLLQHLNSVNKTRNFTYFLWTSVSVDHFQARVVAHISLDKLRENTCEELMPIHVIATALTQTVLVNSYTHIVLFLQQHVQYTSLVFIISVVRYSKKAGSSKELYYSQRCIYS